jgi:hypothetical protein
MDAGLGEVVTLGEDLPASRFGKGITEAIIEIETGGAVPPPIPFPGFVSQASLPPVECDRAHAAGLEKVLKFFLPFLAEPGLGDHAGFNQNRCDVERHR